MIWLAAIAKKVPLWVWILLLACSIAGLYGYGMYRLGKNSARSETLEKSIEVLRERKGIDEDIRNSTDADLCRRLDGMWDEAGRICL